MKQRFKKLLSIALLMCALTAYAQDRHDREHDAFGKPYFQGRSQGQNLARRLVGDAHELYRCDFDCINGVLAVIPQWSQTFDRHQLGDYFSFRNPSAVEANMMSFRGSLVPGATAANTDVRAENFLLPSDFDGVVTLRPNVKNFIADINFRLNLDEWLCGLYFEVDIPVNWTRWSMGLEERVINAGTNFSIPASSNPTGAPIGVTPFSWPTPLHSIIEAWKGEFNGTVNFTSPLPVPAPAPNPINITIEEMKYARIRGHKSKTGVADLEFVLGYNFFCNDCYHLGANLRVTAPTGTRPDAEFMFEPIVGNGHHVKLGGGLNGHAILWENGCDQSFSLWFDSAFYHEFNARQKRTFDLTANGIGSRYLLYKLFTPGTPGATPPIPFVFANTFVPGPNVNTVESKVKINISGEAILMFDYQRCGFTFDAGYGIWGRSKEHITIVGEIPPNTYGLLGGTPIDNIIPGSASLTNSLVMIDGAGATAIGDGFTTIAGVPNQVFATTEMLNRESAEAPSALSHKVFGHLGYTWEGCDYSPFFGFGGEAEFSGRNNKAFDQWSVWIKTGFAFS